MKPHSKKKQKASRVFGMSSMQDTMTAKHPFQPVPFDAIFFHLVNIVPCLRSTFTIQSNISFFNGPTIFPIQCEAKTTKNKNVERTGMLAVAALLDELLFAIPPLLHFVFSFVREEVMLDNTTLKGFFIKI